MQFNDPVFDKGPAILSLPAKHSIDPLYFLLYPGPNPLPDLTLDAQHTAHNKIETILVLYLQ